jgi:hypothetical protein
MNNPIPLALYLLAVAWAIQNSAKRWVTLLWIIVGLGATLGVFFVLASIWPDTADVLGHVAVIPTLLVSALAGITHMRSHRRPAPPKKA